MDDPDATWVPEPSAPPSAAVGLLAGRYQLEEVIGRGASGIVHAATDRLTGDRVAVKLVPLLGAHARRQLRRELTALLALRIPGVARFRDEGVAGDKSFFVTDLVCGTPFDEGAALRWDALRPRIVGLLDVLARVHLAGVIHRDLKPANVMVDRSGRVIILDFGLAQGRAVERHTGGLIEGSPRYMAPEQRAGQPCDERTDLYAAGGMILEIVTQSRLTSPPGLELLAQAPIPDVLAELLARMLAADPADRPSSALEVLVALGADPRSQIGSAMPPGPWSEAQLQDLFVDKRKSFLHLAEDAAALLYEATSGRESLVRQEIERWIGAGLASWADSGRIAMTRPAIEQIAASRKDSPQTELVSLLESGAEPEEVSAAARRIGATMADAGHLERSLVVLDAAELWAKGTPSEIDLLHDRVAWSLALETPTAAERALYCVQRVEADLASRAHLVALLRGARAAFAGEPERALQHLANKPDVLPEPLEILWYGVRWKAVSQLTLDAHEQELISIEPWARRSALRTSKWKGWLGYLRYRQQRYREAAALLFDAAHTREIARERAQMLYMAAAASMETGDVQSATDAGTRASELFRACRHATLEAMSVCLLRMITLRCGQSEPDLALVEAAADVPSVERHIALTEAGFAFRASDRVTCARLARIVLRGDRTEGLDPVSSLAAALLVAIDADGADIDVAERIDGLTPQIAIQILGLCAHTTLRPHWRARARDLLALLPERGLDQRMEILSVREAMGWLGL